MTFNPAKMNLSELALGDVEIRKMLQVHELLNPVKPEPIRIALVEEDHRIRADLLRALESHGPHVPHLIVVDSLGGMEIPHVREDDVITIAKELTGRQLAVTYDPALDDTISNRWNEMAKVPKGKSKYTRARGKRKRRS